jgi:DNA-binding response OmpR family regulator
MAQQTILVVDDKTVWHILLGKLFVRHGYRVLTVSSCAAAIKTAARFRPGCVVLDFRLGDGTAETVCTAIRAHERRRTPIIIFSGDPAAENCVGGKDGADKFLPKLTPLKELLAVVNALLAGQK